MDSLTPPQYSNAVFKDLIEWCVIIYIDYILIYSLSYEEHMTHVRMVLSHFRKHQLYVKEEKHKHSITSVFL
ncbi:hypothetical protein QTP86_022070 [Hemibagrus guttatus]|nr:hypothetical protein QTP86_022070 [Hemibagrus guttatus]